MQIIEYLGIDNIVKFMLLFARFSGLVAFFPFFSHMKIPVSVKTVMVLLFTIMMMPYAKSVDVDINMLDMFLFIVSEIMLGFMAGLSLFLVFGMLELAGMQISFVMGFTMANAIDPQSGLSSPLISNFLTLIALTFFVIIDAHHLIILFFYNSLQLVPLGGFYPNVTMWEYLTQGMASLFVFGFIFSFPIKAMSLLADVIFGMLMKTMPQFNLLVVGFPIKIMISFVVMISILSAVFSVFKTQILKVIQSLAPVFLG